MQIRCYHCHKPFAISKETIAFALNEMNEKGLSHYDVVCPHCRRVNKVSAKELKHAMPNWKPASK